MSIGSVRLGTPIDSLLCREMSAGQKVRAAVSCAVLYNSTHYSLADCQRQPLQRVIWRLCIICGLSEKPPCIALIFALIVISGRPMVVPTVRHIKFTRDWREPEGGLPYTTLYSLLSLTNHYALTTNHYKLLTFSVICAIIICIGINGDKKGYICILMN